MSTGARFTLDQLSPKARAEAEAQLGLRKDSPLGPVSLRPALVVEPKTTAIRQAKHKQMNKLETLFWDYLEGAYPKCHRHAQALNLDLANGCRFRPDFFVIQEVPNTDEATRAETPVLHKVYAYETKGITKKGKMLIEDDAVVKIKQAAHQYRWIQFFLVAKDMSKPSGFRVERVLP